MRVSAPNIIEGENYPYYSINLIITSNYDTGKESGSAVLRLTPTRVDETGIVYKPEHSKSLILGNLDDLNEPEKTAVQNIYQALQDFINNKGL